MKILYDAERNIELDFCGDSFWVVVYKSGTYIGNIERLTSGSFYFCLNFSSVSGNAKDFATAINELVELHKQSGPRFSDLKPTDRFSTLGFSAPLMKIAEFRTIDNLLKNVVSLSTGALYYIDPDSKVTRCRLA